MATPLVQASRDLMGFQSQERGTVTTRLGTRKEAARNGGVQNVVKPAPMLIPLCVSMTLKCQFIVFALLVL